MRASTPVLAWLPAQAAPPAHMEVDPPYSPIVGRTALARALFLRTPSSPPPKLLSAGSAPRARFPQPELPRARPALQATTVSRALQRAPLVQPRALRGHSLPPLQPAVPVLQESIASGALQPVAAALRARSQPTPQRARVILAAWTLTGLLLLLIYMRVHPRTVFMRRLSCLAAALLGTQALLKLDIKQQAPAPASLQVVCAEMATM